MKNSPQPQRIFLFITAALLLMFAVGYYTQAPWAIATWPAQTKLFTHTFLAAFLAAIAAPMIWIALSQEWRAMAAGALNLIVLAIGFTVFTFQLANSNSQSYSLIFPIVGLFFLPISIGVFLWSRRQPLRAERPTPRLAHISFIVFAVTLIGVGGLLALRVNDRIIPWTILPDTAILIGWIFLGDAAYFLYAVRHSTWGIAVGPLLSFLVYDLVLLPRMLGHFSDIPTDQLLSLIIYNAVMIYSALLGITYLVLNKATRLKQSSDQL
jgi:hypothetical protein